MLIFIGSVPAIKLDESKTLTGDGQIHSFPAEYQLRFEPTTSLLVSNSFTSYVVSIIIAPTFLAKSITLLSLCIKRHIEYLNIRDPEQLYAEQKSSFCLAGLRISFIITRRWRKGGWLTLNVRALRSRPFPRVLVK